VNIMIIYNTLLILALGATPAAAGQDQYTTVTTKVYNQALSSKDTVVYLRVNVAIGEALVIEYPDGISLAGGEPVIGDVSLLKVETTPSPLMIRVWGKIFQGSTEGQMYNLNGNVQFKTNVGITFIFNFIITPPESASNRIVFTYPEFEGQMKEAQKALAILKNKLQTDYETKEKNLDQIADRRAFEMITDKFSDFYMCNSYTNRSEKTLVFLGSDRICRLGDDTILINFMIKNRYRQYFYVKSIKVFQMNGNNKVEVDNPYIHMSTTGIKFDQILNGAIGIRSKDYTTNYMIQLEEEGGLKRIIQLEVGF